MKIKEIMTKEVVSVKPTDSALEALGLLFKREISGLPVIDEQARLVGMFTEKDILEHILPSYIGNVGKFIYEENPKSTRKKFGVLNTVKVSQIMRKQVVSVTEDTTLCEAARIMLTQKTRRLPVLDKNGKVAGIVARGDVLKAFAEEAQNL
jgi:CBS domain-containing protein